MRILQSQYYKIVFFVFFIVVVYQVAYYAYKQHKLSPKGNTIPYSFQIINQSHCIYFNNQYIIQQPIIGI
ncbi:unnamed protein product [Paramecium octaurelia]|uniref:Uncharacterized protein n=1 Tax=Paramecium octaurelia TaxID=43137 RepID=A0A8S1TB45_PAROT|nr:unnamed protein product [Paramecium octaurelia]